MITPRQLIDDLVEMAKTYYDLLLLAEAYRAGQFLRDNYTPPRPIPLVTEEDKHICDIGMMRKLAGDIPLDTIELLAVGENSGRHLLEDPNYLIQNTLKGTRYMLIMDCEICRATYLGALRHRIEMDIQRSALGSIY
jgi:hypothetical protein